MTRRQALRRSAATGRGDALDRVEVAMRGNALPDFAPGDFVTPRTGRPWTVRAVWFAAWAYADEHDGGQSFARAAWAAFSRAYDTARGLTPRSTRSLMRQEFEGRLRGVDFDRDRPEEP